MIGRQFRILISALICVGAQAACGQTAPEKVDPIKGLWAWAADEAPFQIDIEISRVDDEWRAQIQGQSSPIRIEAGQITISHSDGNRFEGQLTEREAEITGRWYQPSNTLAYSNMVTLTRLVRVDEGRWRGQITSQARPFRVFLDVFETDTGDIAAVMRNPERNEILRTNRFKIESGASGGWALVSGAGERATRHAFKMIDGSLHFEHAWLGKTLEMRKISADDAIGYLPRPSREEPFSFTTPPQLDDGWSITTPEDAGFDRELLDNLVQDLSTSDPRSERPRLVHAMLVAHRGELLLEEYFYGYDRDTTHDTRSLSKVFAPVLIGALQSKDVAISSDDRPIPQLLADAGEPLDDPRKADITLAHLMSFSSGLDCEANENSPGSEDRMWGQSEETDFWLYTSRLPVLFAPGTRYAYCSGSINLAGAAIRRAGGIPIVELFDELIAKPLNFGPYQWNLAPNGAAYLGGGAYMRPRDLLKIGAMYEMDGQWNGNQITDPAWIAESTETFIEITPETTGLTPEAFNNTYFGGGSAYEWRVDEVRSGEHTFRSYEATGNGGQKLIVVPDLDLTVLFMGGNYRQGYIWGRWRNELIGGYLVPALMDKTEDAAR